MFTFLFDDVGSPLNYGHMDDFGVKSFTLIRRDGKAHVVKFHWKAACGVKCLLDDEAVTVGDTCHTHATKDLTESIAAGNYLEWKHFIQTIDADHED
jgi:catalase